MSTYIIRHGSTKLNSEKKIRGWLDVPLDEQGKKEAKNVGKKLKGKVDTLVSSDLDRTQETAHIISKITGAPIALVSKAFRPWHVGDYSGKKDMDVLKVIFDYAEHHPDEKLPGGESFNEFKTRFLQGLKQVLQQHQGKNVGIVTHHRGDRITQAWENKGMPDNHEIHMPTFQKKGIEPGDFRQINIPQQAKPLNMPDIHQKALNKVNQNPKATGMQGKMKDMNKKMALLSFMTNLSNKNLPQASQTQNSAPPFVLI